MWQVFSFTIIAFGARSEDNVEPAECNGPPPIRINPHDCCDKPIFKPDFRSCLENIRQLMAKRYGDAPSENTGETKTGDDDTCLANCFFNKNVFNDNGVSRDELIKALETQSNDTAWTSVHSIAVDNCITILESESQNIENTKLTKNCNRFALRMLLCVNVQYFVNCPETHFQTNNENCKALQEHIKKCPMPKGPWGRGRGGGGF